MRLIDEGRGHLMLQQPLALDCPVRILHGMQDPDVPWQQSLQLVDKLVADDVTVTFVKHGDHRLSAPDDLERLIRTVEDLSEGHLRRILSSYFDYYHRTRTHLSLEKDCPEPRPVHPPDAGKVIAFPQVGGLHHRYERLAA